MKKSTVIRRIQRAEYARHKMGPSKNIARIAQLQLMSIRELNALYSEKVNSEENFILGLDLEVDYSNINNQFDEDTKKLL